MEFLGGANSILKLACRCAISDGVPRRSLYVALIVGTRAQPDQSGRCAARNGIHQLAETDLDLLRTLRGVYLRRSLVSVEESGCDTRTKRMTRRRSCHPSLTNAFQPHSSFCGSLSPLFCCSGASRS